MTDKQDPQPGQRVRFHLGERQPDVRPCCGPIDTFEYLKDFHGQVFEVMADDLPYRNRCPQCHTIVEPNLDRTIHLAIEFSLGGLVYQSFRVYPQEVEVITE